MINRKIKPFSYERADTCPSCNSKRSLEAYSRFDKPVRLSLHIDRNMELGNVSICYFKCRNCGSEFFPKWVKGFKYPLPMFDSNYSDFMNSYILSYKRAES